MDLSDTEEEQKYIKYEQQVGEKEEEHKLESKPRGNLFLVYAIVWNRLDVIDVATGEVITKRLTGEAMPVDSPYQGNRKELYYSFCGLEISQDSSLIASSGWLSHPVGVVAWWSLKDWLDGDLYLSECPSYWHDISSAWYGKISIMCLFFCATQTIIFLFLLATQQHTPHYYSHQPEYYHHYCRGMPLCWAGHRLVHWGVGLDGQHLMRAIAIYDVDTKEQREIGEVPRGPMWYDNGILFVISALNRSLSAWDIDTEEFLVDSSDANALTYHPSSQVFLAVNNDEDAFQLVSFTNTTRN